MTYNLLLNPYLKPRQLSNLIVLPKQSKKLIVTTNWLPIDNYWPYAVPLYCLKNPTSWSYIVGNSMLNHALQPALEVPLSLGEQS